MDCSHRFYNARRAQLFGKKLTNTDTLVYAVSKPHTHVEFQFSPRYDNISFSATMADDANCCRFKSIDYLKHPERWDTIVEHYADWEEDIAYKRAKELEGKPYDLIGVLSLINEATLILPNKNKYWCSEVDEELRFAVGKDHLLKRPDLYTPEEVFFELLYYANKEANEIG